MKTSDSKLTLKQIEMRTDGKHLTFNLEFALHEEDFAIAQDLREYVNGINEMNMDIADFLQACITHELHQMKETLDGTPFVLRMDRPKHQS